MGFEIYRFSGGVFDYKEDASTKEAKALLGGKGAGLVVMAQAGMPVPPGFTIPTTACHEYMAFGSDQVARNAWMAKLTERVIENMEWLTEKFGYRPLVSVRSGAPISMPGMMDTILNVGLTVENSFAWEERIGKRATADSMRRLVQMLGATGYGVPMGVFDFKMAKAKKELNKASDTDLNDAELLGVVDAYLKAFHENKGFPFPDKDWKEQLRVAIKAVFESWNSERATEYRKLNKIDDSMGTAVNVQAMVFGNMGDDSGSGVLFTRNPSTGERAIMAEYLKNAQGEDVVAGIRTPEKLELTGKANGDGHSPAWQCNLAYVCEQLETMYRDMVDVEFTVQKGELYLLQSRTGKRSARAAFKIAVDLVAEGVIQRTEALKRLTKEQFKVVRRPMIDPSFKVKPHLTGIPACPGIVAGRPVFSSNDAVAAKDDVILVTHETSPNDIAGMAKSVGILTQTGGATSHAAVVARAMDRACVVGCTDMKLTEDGFEAKLVTIDGSTGNVWFDVKVPTIDASDDPAVRQVVEWCYELTGACENVPVDIGVARPHRVVAAEWWGSEKVLKAVLSGIAALPIKSHIVLDLTPPKELQHPDDLMVLGICGQDEADLGFDAVLSEQLSQFSNKLGGLRLIGDMDDVAAAEALGFQVISASAAPEALPADYVALSVLG